MTNQSQNPQPDQPTLHIEHTQQPDEIKVPNPPNPQPDQPNQHLQQ
ncbi:hypothetical protein [Acinetobacter terrae]|jgi:hypothetical protein|uniref:Uncharacterized protein n=1 Tax=Acinetobacter terrae TaxID=2731247 RepID=A0A7Y2RXA5_9GAMM|nr:hypothetical protein [Acinetobacter terrae]NNH17230.1 hypothetical protein [Acinetobacter terrae]NNH40021.1 hypothetical protein [Acinetobacter terrae]NNH77837.1 hypothetical protein [Acinetobacter terrae]NNH86488.1 hypothetical protein [Acinetobacter terrae]